MSAEGKDESGRNALDATTVLMNIFGPREDLRRNSKAFDQNDFLVILVSGLKQFKESSGFLSSLNPLGFDNQKME